MTPHTLVGGAQTTLTATPTASARADRRDCPSEAWGPRGKAHSPPLDALGRLAGGTGAVSTAPKWLVSSKETRVGKGLHGKRIRIHGKDKKADVVHIPLQYTMSMIRHTHSRDSARESIVDRRLYTVYTKIGNCAVMCIQYTRLRMADAHS